VLAYDGFDELDALGPYEVLSKAAEVSLVSPAGGGTVTGSHGLELAVQGRLGECELLVVPGGGWNDRAPAGAYAEAQRGELPEAIRTLHERGTVVASVCTGAMLVSAAGLLRGRPATTHHRAIEALRAHGAEIVAARVVDDGDVLSCGGVTSGIDLALWLVERERGADVAQQIAAEIEYERRGPLWRR